MENLKISSKPEPDETKKHLIELVTVLRKWFEAWASVFQSIEITELQLAVYANALFEFSADRVDDACAEVTKTAEFFPVPANIRAHIRLPKQQWESPDIVHALPNPEYKKLLQLRQEETQAQIEKNWEIDRRHLPTPEIFRKKHPPKAVSEQIAELKKKGWLK
jgi:hypothetical protein